MVNLQVFGLNWLVGDRPATCLGAGTRNVLIASTPWGSVSKSKNVGVAMRLVSAWGEFWCKRLHKNVSMPICGHYRCLRCNRIYPVPWEETRKPPLRVVRGFRAQPLKKKDLRDAA
jgi:hypothetical protein